jgi:uncharacterized protein (DUF1697 family)
MPCYAAFLRGVSPQNARMPELKRAFEAAGFSEVRTLLSSGNVLFTARAASEPALARKAEAAMNATLGRTFMTLVRAVEDLRALLASDPYAGVRLKPGSKRVITFLRQPPQPAPKLPIERDGARILRVEGDQVFSAYVPGPRGPVFMTLLEQTFGKEITTRTWDTVQKMTR